MDLSGHFHSDYRRYFTDSFEARSIRNPAYSMRAFSRDLGLAVSTLTELIKGRYGLSKVRALQVGKRLGLSDDQCSHLVDLICAEHAKRSLEREAAAIRIKARLCQSTTSLTVDAFRVISDWYHLALLELMMLPEFQPTLPWMSSRLGLPQAVIREALERLQRLELVERTDRGFRPAGDFTAVGSGLPSDAIRRFHGQILEKAREALETRSVNEREFSSTVFSIHREDLAAAKKDLLRFRREFATKYSESKNPMNDVFCLSVQFFSLLNGAVE